MFIRILPIFIMLAQVPALGIAWNNGQSGNAATDDPAECINPPYSTHDWIADQALNLLPDEAKAWLVHPQRRRHGNV